MLLRWGGGTRIPASGGGDVKHLILFVHLWGALQRVVGAIAVVVVIIGVGGPIRVIASTSVDILVD
jgi:uncharacterized membrane protein YccF (DUF307 family)